MRFQVSTLAEVNHQLPQHPHIVISISDTPADRHDIVPTEGTKDVLYLHFHDADIERPGVLLFNSVDAGKILRFYERYRNEVDSVVVHCVAGQCRSPAVAAGLQKIETGNDDIWFKTKTPNMLVYRTLLEEAYDYGML